MRTARSRGWSAQRALPLAEEVESVELKVSQLTTFNSQLSSLPFSAEILAKDR